MPDQSPMGEGSVNFGLVQTVGVVALIVIVAAAALIFLIKSLNITAPKVTQKASASERSNVTQAARDSFQVETLNWSQQVFQEMSNFLAEGEVLLVSRQKDFGDFRKQNEEHWMSARDYVYGVSLYGRRFMPSDETLFLLASKCVSICMILVDPYSPAANAIVHDKVTYSRTVGQQALVENVYEQPRMSPEDLLAEIRRDVDDTRIIMSRIKDAYPAANVSLRFIDFLPVWKGTIVDGLSASYVIYDVPRVDVPFRWTERTELVHYYQERYFDSFFRQSNEVSLRST